MTEKLMYNNTFTKTINELFMCVVEQDFGIVIGDMIGVDLITYLKLKKIEKSMEKIDIRELNECPKCKKSWDGGDIAEELFKAGNYKTIKEAEKAAEFYSWRKNKKTRFSKLIGIEDRKKYDGVSEWQCPFCKTRWDRWTGKEVEIDD